MAGRFLSGLLNGNAGVVKTYVGETTEKSQQTMAFSIFAMAFGFASCVAPAIGGFLQRPAERWPGVFGDTVFETFPFLLPMLCAAALTSFGGALGFLYAPETASQWRRMQKRREERERATRTSLLVTTKREERGRRDVHRDGEDGDVEALLRAAADAEGDGGLGVGPGFSEVELVRLDESGVSQAVVAEAPESRTEKAPRDAAGAKTASSASGEAEAEDDDDDETRLLRGTTAANDAFSFSVRGRDRSVAIRDDAALRHLRQHGWDAHTIVAASSYAGLAFIAIGYDEILPVYAATREDLAV